MFKEFLKRLFNISDRSSCTNNCLFYRKNECYLYGAGHRAIHPCTQYDYHAPKIDDVIKDVENDDLVN